MPSSIHAHLIGTLTLLTIMFLVEASFIAASLSMYMDMVRTQLQEVSDYVALNILNLIALAHSSRAEGLFIIKLLELPKNIGMRAYVVELLNETGACRVVAYLQEWTWLKAESIIPLNETGAPIKLELGEGEAFNVRFSRRIFSGAPSPAAWCLKDGGLLKVGLGKVG